MPDSYGIAVLKSAVLNHCGIKTKKVINLGNMNRDSNTLNIRKKFLKKIANYASNI